MRTLDHQIYSFDGFTLDLTRGCLLRGDEEVKLRPKSFAALHYLVENSGRLVSKDELIEAVWPGTAVTDNSLVQCLKEVREALGDSAQHYIKTVPRRGYIFQEQVKDGTQVAAASRYTEEIEGIRVVIDGEEEAESEEYLQEREKRVLPAAIVKRPTSDWLTNRKILLLVLLSVGLIASLTYLIPRKPSRPQTVAVLPFRPLGQAGRDEYLEFGMADALITKLSNIKQIVVRPTSSVHKYLGQDKDPVAVGRELGVESVLAGSIQRLGDRVRINVQLVSVSDGRPLWAEKFDEKFTDIFALQDSISVRVAQALSLQLTGEGLKGLSKRYTENVEAYQLCARGRYLWEKATKEDLLKAVAYFEQAIQLDPNYALAYAGIAHCYGPLGYQGYIPATEARSKMKAAAQKAIEIDGTLVEAHTALGAVKAFYEWDWTGAETDFRRAIELNPNYTTAHAWYGLYLEAMGRHEESLTARRRAVELDPLNVKLSLGLGSAFYHAGQYDRAVEIYHKTLESDPNFFMLHQGLGAAFEQKGLYEDSIAEFRKAVSLPGNIARSKAYLAHAYATAGKRAEAKKIEQELSELSKGHYVSPFDFAVIHVGLGDLDRAFEWLEKAYLEGDPALNHLKVEPRLKSLQPDRRFQELLQRMRLAP